TDDDHRSGQRGRSGPRDPKQLRLQRSLQEAVRCCPAGRAHPHARRAEAREQLSLEEGPATSTSTTLLTAGRLVKTRWPGRFRFCRYLCPRRPAPQARVVLGDGTDGSAGFDPERLLLNGQGSGQQTTVLPGGWPGFHLRLVRVCPAVLCPSAGGPVPRRQ